MSKKKYYFLIFIVIFSITLNLSEENFTKYINNEFIFNKLINLKKSDIKLLLLVNKENGLPNVYKPKNLVKLPDDICMKNRIEKISWEVYLPLLKMIEKAKKEGIKLKILSAYRSYEYQKKLYNRCKNVYSKEKLNKLIAKPGHSQHQLGLTVDFNSLKYSFANTKAGKWLKNNAYKYGFSISYPKHLTEYTGYMFEPWHYRYIGKKNARIVRNYFNGNQEKYLKIVNYLFEINLYESDLYQIDFKLINGINN